MSTEEFVFSVTFAKGISPQGISFLFIKLIVLNSCKLEEKLYTPISELNLNFLLMNMSHCTTSYQQ